MLEKFLSIPNSFGVLWLVLTILSIIVTYVIARRKNLDWDDAIRGWFLPFFVVIVFCLEYGTRVEYINVSDYPWKQIYTNNINAEVTLKRVELWADNNHTLNAGEELGENAYLLRPDRPARTDYEITARVDGETVTKRAEISEVISDGEITSTSKIVKIEYRPYKGYYQKLGSTTGDRIPALEGSAEIRVTLKNSANSKLNDLFDPEK